MAKLPPIRFDSFVKGVTILVIIYLFFGVFTTGGIGYKDGQWYNTIAFEFGKSFDALTFFVSFGIAVAAYLLFTYLFQIPSISNRKQYFILIGIGVLLFVAYLIYLNPTGIIPAFKGSLIDTTTQSLISLS